MKKTKATSKQTTIKKNTNPSIGIRVPEEQIEKYIQDRIKDYVCSYCYEANLPKAYELFLCAIWPQFLMLGLKKFVEGQLYYGGNFFLVNGPKELNPELADSVHYNNIALHKQLANHPSLDFLTNKFTAARK